MKKGLLVFGVMIVLLAGAVFALATIDFNRMGKSNAYYEIGGPASIDETKLDSGEVLNRYVYDGAAYKENGEEIQVEFTAGKQLREGAYLMLYLDKNELVTSYDEVQADDIPEQVKF